MTNELLLILQLVGFYGMVILSYRLFGKKGLFCWSTLATILANIEVLISVTAFGRDMTMGNILFATTFVVTDILSEVSSKKDANKAVNLSIFTSAMFVIISQSWLLSIPNSSDFVFDSIKTLFSNTPRLMVVSLIVYAVVQRFDVWAYHKWWKFTEKKFRDKKKYLWLRNNGSTLLSQFFNAMLYSLGAFYGIYDIKTVISIGFATYFIYIITSIADTPVVYICRYLKEKGKIKEEN